MSIVGYRSSTRRAPSKFVRGTVTAGFDRNRSALRSNTDVAIACMNDFHADDRYLHEQLPDVVGELEHWLVPRRAPGPAS